ncbi:MAG TPA: hypothetical protein DCQ59_04545, partial [Verrucomicrobiales bacterium]|nr:hypothetical protein [Verrucomicrobiales bacterium]
MTYFAFSCAIVLACLLVGSIKRQQRLEKEWGRLKKKLGQSELKHEEDYSLDLQNLLDALPYPFFSINKEGVLNRFNSQARHIFGSRDILNRSIHQVFLDSAITSLLSKSLTELKPYREILRFPPDSVFSSQTPDKDSHWEIDIYPLSLGSSSREIQLMMRDITASVHSDQIRQD